MLLSAYDDECKVNATWVLGLVLDKSPALQRTAVQHDGVTLLLRMCAAAPPTPLLPVDAHHAGGGGAAIERSGHAADVDSGTAVAAVTAGRVSEVPAVAAWALGLLCQVMLSCVSHAVAVTYVSLMVVGPALSASGSLEGGGGAGCGRVSGGAGRRRGGRRAGGGGGRG